MRNLDRFRGCLIGGAAGDALGYSVEFMREEEIFSRYGTQGITEYDLSNGVAQISDDTQMTLFTATGLLVGTTRGKTRGIMGKYADYIHRSYLDWYKTQNEKYPLPEEYHYSWLVNEPELFSRRAPGNTCLSALRNTEYGTIERPVNNSKGCGGVMRVAPVGLYFCDRGMDAREIARIGAEAAAITHGHDLGWMPAAALVQIIYEISQNDETVLNAVLHSLDTVRELWPDSSYKNKFTDLIKKAVDLAYDKQDDLSAIHCLGEGWVAEETLAIAVYCALKYENDFNRALIASVNHKGDSDSTGAVTGNILGAKMGLSGIPAKYLADLELKNVILEVADDLYHDCRMSEYDRENRDPVWEQKYIEMTYRCPEAIQKQKNFDELTIEGKVVPAVFFHLPDEPYGFLSNWYLSDFEINGIKFNSNEQYIMYRKAEIFGDSQTAEAVLNAKTPAEQQKLGQMAKGYNDTLWFGLRQVVTMRGLYARFSQNEELKKKLLDTDEAFLVECAYSDLNWACGWRLIDPQRKELGKWRGKNLLGFALMEVREQLRELG